MLKIYCSLRYVSCCFWNNRNAAQNENDEILSPNQNRLLLLLQSKRERERGILLNISLWHPQHWAKWTEKKGFSLLFLMNDSPSFLSHLQLKWRWPCRSENSKTNLFNYENLYLIEMLSHCWPISREWIYISTQYFLFAYFLGLEWMVEKKFKCKITRFATHETP